MPYNYRSRPDISCIGLLLVHINLYHQFSSQLCDFIQHGSLIENKFRPLKSKFRLVNCEVERKDKRINLLGILGTPPPYDRSSRVRKVHFPVSDTRTRRTPQTSHHCTSQTIVEKNQIITINRLLQESAEQHTEQSMVEEEEETNRKLRKKHRYRIKC